MSTNTTVSYDFDPSGTLAANKITGEITVLSAPNYSDFYFIVPRAAPYFVESLQIIHLPTSRVLVRGVDWVPSYRFHDASLACAKEIAGAITFYDKTLAGAIRYNYQTIGGPWTLDETKILELLSNAVTDPRVTTWEQVVERPIDFPVIDHQWNLTDLVGMSAVVEAANAIAEAIAESGSAALPAHLADHNNPHQVTQAQVGLDQVQNYPIATPTEAATGTATNRYMTPLRTRQAITAVLATTLDVHTADQNNPHGVNAQQVGLGSVANYPVASTTEAQAGASTVKYMTPALVKAAIDSQVMAVLTPHVQSTANPHQTTKAQVALGSVENYPVADTATARAGTSNAHYMTPAMVREAINAQLLTNLDAHIADHSNPHQVNKDQVGLPNVQNYPVATTQEAQAGTATDRYMTPAAVKAAIEALGGSQFNSHIADTNNPHQTTKDQINLGNVANYGVATVPEAQAGVSNVKYMTPSLVAAAILAQGGTDWAAHLLNQNNPHQTTKDQVGLGSVENYPVANQAEAEAGTAANRYMTPQAVAYAVAVLTQGQTQALNAHIADATNPHQTTASQTGAYTIAEVDEHLARLTVTYPQVDDLTGKTWTKLFSFTPVDTTELMDSNDVIFELSGGDQKFPVIQSQFRITLPASGLGPIAGIGGAQVHQIGGSPTSINFGYTAESIGYAFWIHCGPHRTGLSVRFISNPGVELDGTVQEATPVGIVTVDSQVYRAQPANYDMAPGDLVFAGTPSLRTYSVGQMVEFLNVADTRPGGGEAESSVNNLQANMVQDAIDFLPRSYLGSTPPQYSTIFKPDTTNDSISSTGNVDSRLHVLTTRNAGATQVVEVILSSLNSSGNALGVCAAQVTSQGKTYAIHVLRSPGQLVVDARNGLVPGGTNYGLFTVGVNLMQDDATILSANSGGGLLWGDGVAAANRDLTAQPYNQSTGGWPAAGAIRLRITRTSNQLVIETTNPGSTTYIDAVKVTLSLTAASGLQMFQIPGEWGLLNYKQAAGNHVILARPDYYHPYVLLKQDANGFDTSTYSQWTGSAWLTSTLNGSNVRARPGRLVLSDWNGHLFYWRRDGSLRAMPLHQTI
jgi:hypothetical protein